MWKGWKISGHYLKLLSRHSPWGTEKNHKNQSAQALSSVITCTWHLRYITASTNLQPALSQATARLQLTSNTQCLTSLWQVANLQDLASELFEPPSHGSLLSWQLMTFYGSFLPGEILKFDPSISTCFYQEKERTTAAHPSSDWLTYPYHHFLKETWKIIISTFLYQIKWNNP